MTITTTSTLDELVELAAPQSRQRVLGDAVVLDELAKTYPNGTEAVRGISLRVAHGEAFGILGPNGAGKSTTIGILGTLVKPTGGRARVEGFDVALDPMEVRRRIGFAMQDVGMDDFATASELMVLQGRLQGLRKADAMRRAALLLRIVGLEDAAGKRVSTLSGGTRRRVDLAASLMHLPPIVFLDEPTEGLDPRSRSAIWEALGELRSRLGVTLLITTHHMNEVDALCDRIGIIDQGKLVVEGTPESLTSAATPTLEDVYLHHTRKAAA
jgi:ABC-2 type transport system ATP-binding protein